MERKTLLVSFCIHYCREALPAFTSYFKDMSQYQQVQICDPAVTTSELYDKAVTNLGCIRQFVKHFPASAAVFHLIEDGYTDPSSTYLAVLRQQG